MHLPKRIGTSFGNVTVHDTHAFCDFGNLGFIISKNEQGNPQVCLVDHCTITVLGSVKDEPIVQIDSDEFLTYLRVRQSESAWKEVQIQAGVKVFTTGRAT